MGDRGTYRVLMLHNAYQTRGGEEESAESECRVLREAGHHVEYVSVHNDAIKTGRDKIRAAFTSVWSPTWYRRTLQMLSEQRFDVLHVQNFFPQISPSVYYAAHKAGVPVVQAMRNYRLACPAATLLRNSAPCTDCVGRTLKLPGVRNRCYRGSAAGSATVAAMSGVHKALGTWKRRVAVYLPVSQWVADILVAEGIPPERIIVKPCFCYQLNPRGAAAPDARENVLFVGRLSPEKGLPLLLDAWSRVKTQAKLRIVGEGEIPPDLPGNVEILGRMSVLDVQKEMAKAAFVVMPGNWAEPFGRVAVEAFSQATPVIATNIGGVADIVRPGVNGDLFERGNAADLTRRIQALLNDPERRRKYGQAAYRTFVGRYSPDQNLRFVEQAYAAAIARHVPDQSTPRDAEASSSC